MKWLGLVCVGLALADCSPGATALDSPAALLEESYQRAAALPVDESLRLLLRLSTEAARVHPDACRRWSIQLFRRMFQSAPSADRVALQKNALIALSRVEPEQAFALLSLVDGPAAGAGTGGEDVRADGAREVFRAYWKAGDAARLAKIQRVAREFSADGQYPFGAVAPMLADLLRRDPVAGNAWFAEITPLLAKAASEWADRQFLLLVKSVWTELTPESRRVAVDALYSRLAGPRERSESSGYLAEVETNRGTFQIRAHRELLLLQMTPWLRKIAPDLLKEVVKLGRAFQAAGESGFEIRRVCEVNVVARDRQGTADTERRIATISSDRRILEQFGETLGMDAAAALEVAQRIQTPAISSAALMDLAEAMPQNDRATALRVFREASRPRTDPLLVLALQIVRASAANAAANTGEFKTALTAAFDSAEQLFAEHVRTHPGSVAEEAEVMNSAATLVRIGMAGDRAYTLERIRKASNPLLGAHLLIDAAR